MPRKKSHSQKNSPKKTGYGHEREQFYNKHPMARLFLGFLIIAFAFFLGVQYRNYKAKQFVSLQLIEEDIIPALGQ